MIFSNLRHDNWWSRDNFSSQREELSDTIMIYYYDSSRTRHFRNWRMHFNFDDYSLEQFHTVQPHCIILINCRLIRSKSFVYNKRSGSVGVRHLILYAFSVGVMNWFVREKDDYMFLYENYYLFSYIIDISVDFEPHFYK